MNQIQVDLGERTYPVLIGTECLEEGLDSLLPDRVQKVALVTQSNIGIIPSINAEHEIFHIDNGEIAKTLKTVEDLCSRWAQWGLTRTDVVVAIGGGLVTDIAGFAAAVYHRGVDVIHVPTTLLGMVDAAIGGKTAVNLPEGKNLVGSFWQPVGVVCDISTLSSLPEREWRCGYGEVAKYHFLGAQDLDQQDLAGKIMKCIQLKAEIVREDERETGRRAVLNYGHTLAHALEMEKDFSLAHGEAVAIGIRYAAEIAKILGRIDQKRVEEHESVLEHYGLSYKLPSSYDWGQLVSLFQRDKKAVDGISFVLDGPEGIEVVKIEDQEILIQAMEALQ
ncbi:MAG: 3-dehydroquinate synthase family protein [Actinomycetota bacterium]|nr:3-dehydroquinate synthase family protein [Actinomycetota bacterium]